MFLISDRTLGKTLSLDGHCCTVYFLNLICATDISREKGRQRSDLLFAHILVNMTIPTPRMASRNADVRQGPFGQIPSEIPIQEIDHLLQTP
jgi:hypothetical protein